MLTERDLIKITRTTHIEIEWFGPNQNHKPKYKKYVTCTKLGLRNIVKHLIMSVLVSFLPWIIPNIINVNFVYVKKEVRSTKLRQDSWWNFRTCLQRPVNSVLEEVFKSRVLFFGSIIEELFVILNGNPPRVKGMASPPMFFKNFVLFKG